MYGITVHVKWLDGPLRLGERKVTDSHSSPEKSKGWGARPRKPENLAVFPVGFVHAAAPEPPTTSRHATLSRMPTFVLTKRQQLGGLLNAAERELAYVKAQTNPDQNAIAISKREVQRRKEELDRLLHE